MVPKNSYRALTLARRAPKSPGMYLAYHLKRIFGQSRYFSGAWSRPFQQRPVELMLEFDKYLTNILSELSNGTTKNVSILDMPGSGSMFQGKVRRDSGPAGC